MSHWKSGVTKSEARAGGAADQLPLFERTGSVSAPLLRVMMVKRDRNFPHRSLRRHFAIIKADRSAAGRYCLLKRQLFPAIQTLKRRV